MSWARVDDGLWEHPKFEELRLGGHYAAGFLWLLSISHCGAKLNPRITVLEAMMLLACDEGTAREACETLRSTGLFDADSASKQVPGGGNFASKQTRSYLIHDWQEYRSKSEAKVLAGRKGGKKSGESRRAALEAKPKQAQSRSGPASKQARSPDPDPDSDPGSDPDTDTVTAGACALGPSLAPVDLSAGNKHIRAQVLEVIGAWRDSGHPDDFLTPHSGLREWRAIEDRLSKDGATVAQLQKAIKGIHLDDWEGRARNRTLWHVVKDLASVQRLCAIADADRQPVLSEMTRKSLKAVESWAKRRDKDDAGSGQG